MRDFEVEQIISIGRDPNKIGKITAVADSYVRIHPINFEMVGFCEWFLKDNIFPVEECELVGTK